MRVIFVIGIHRAVVPHPCEGQDSETQPPSRTDVCGEEKSMIRSPCTHHAIPFDPLLLHPLLSHTPQCACSHKHIHNAHMAHTHTHNEHTSACTHNAQTHTLKFQVLIWVRRTTPSPGLGCPTQRTWRQCPLVSEKAGGTRVAPHWMRKMADSASMTPLCVLVPFGSVQ